MDYSWIIHRYPWSTHGKFEKPSVCLSRLPLAVFPPGRATFFFIQKLQNPRNHENEKDARNKTIAIRLINSSSTSISIPNMKKHTVGKSMDVRG